MRLSLPRTTLLLSTGRWRWLLATLGYVVIWALCAFFAQACGWDLGKRWLVSYGIAGLFGIGLAWTICILEGVSQGRQARRDQSGQQPHRIWDPLDQDAWYYGQHNNRKLNQSVTVLLLYSLLFLLLVSVVGQLLVGRESYELPAGGGQAKTLAQTIRVQKIVRTKYVVNPYSAIRFEVPPIDDVQLRLSEATEHAYTVGYGQGTGSGFGTGTARGKVRFVRLQYSGGDWDQDFGIGADLNMLLEYGIRTGQKVADRTESRTIAELGRFPLYKSPPVVYLTGEKSIHLSKAEIKTLHRYLLEKHGMLFGDNGGSAHFHRQFLAMMASVLPDIQPVRVPLDDTIHLVPYRIPFLPYVAPHGGKAALGWWVEGRWVCYYHPGDIADAWCDGHAGVKPEVWETCYQLGTNILYYAHLEYARWLESQPR